MALPKMILVWEEEDGEGGSFLVCCDAREVPSVEEPTEIGVYGFSEKLKARKQIQFSRSDGKGWYDGIVPVKKIVARR